MAQIATLYINKFKLPAERDEEDNLIEPNLEITDDMLTGSEEISFEAAELPIKLPEVAKTIKNFNKRQETIFNNNKSRDYIYRKIIMKKPLKNQ